MYTNTHTHTHTHTHTTHTHPHTHTCSDRGLFSVLIICDTKTAVSTNSTLSKHEHHYKQRWTPSFHQTVNSQSFKAQCSSEKPKSDCALQANAQQSNKQIAENGSEQKNFTVNAACHTSDLNKSVHCYLDDEKQMALWGKWSNSYLYCSLKISMKK